MYYRVAIQGDPSLPWQWKSTPLSSLNTVLQWMQFYRALPKERLRIFSSPSREEMNEQPMRENLGLASPSVTGARFLQERMIRSSEMTGSTSRGGAGGQQARASLAVPTTTRWNESSRAAQSVGERGMNVLECRRLALELGPGGYHDLPYSFSLALSLPQVLAWMTLLARVQRGELHP